MENEVESRKNILLQFEAFVNPQYRLDKVPVPDILKDFEQRLEREMKRVSLIGELELSEYETHVLGNEIGNYLKELEKRRNRTSVGASWNDIKNTICNKIPCCFATYLVFQGKYGYRSGDYYSEVRETTGLDLDSNQTSQWGQLFEGILDKFELHRFRSLGRRYVDLILIHGGIPNYCLGDFFEYVVRPFIEEKHTEFVGLSVDEAVESWLKHPPQNADKPVQRFLKYGGGSCH